MATGPTRPIVILGAGLTGLAAAHSLRGTPRVLVERAGEVGGHARSERIGGHTFDVTGHWLHLRDPGVTALVDALLPGQLATIERRTRVFSHEALLAYPFQANLHGLPLEVVELGLLACTLAHRPRGSKKEPAEEPIAMRQRQ